MSLIGALNIGKSAMAVSQAAIQTTGNNISNAGNADYTRQVSSIAPNRDQQIQSGIFLGTGVNLASVQRQIDEALESRIRGSLSDEQAADVTQQWIGRVESVFNELSDQDLSTQLSTFFNSWSNLANKPQDLGLRQVVVQNGSNVASTIQDLRTQFSSLQGDLDKRLEVQAKNADALAQQVADLNGQIVVAEGGTGGIANGLRDQRDAVLKSLSELVNIKTVPQANGVTNVYVGSEPLVTDADNFGIGFRTESVEGKLNAIVYFKNSGGELNLSSGQLGALKESRDAIDTVVDQLDSLAGNLIFELNKIHSSGQGLEGFKTVSSDNLVDDATVPLNDDDANLPFAPVNGSFVVHVKNKITGLTSSTLIQVDLDGHNADDTSLASLANDLNAIGNISANANSGRLNITSDSNDVEFSFSQDSSGVLAALGINTFFNGTKASDIAVNAQIKASPSLLAAAQNGEHGDNQSALSIAALESASLSALGGSSLKQSYEGMINGVATSASAARTHAEAASTIRETLQAQREALSGVSLDEEAVNLIKQQRAFQGAAKLISTVNELMNTLMNMI
jgi:flagellar hook-associated protein 1 FlgK